MGPGAKESENFVEPCVLFLKSSLAYDPIKELLSCFIVQSINDHGG